MAESGLLFQRFAENITAAILPKAAAKLELAKEAANDPMEFPQSDGHQDRCANDPSGTAQS